jgi:hypothetical protein
MSWPLFRRVWVTLCNLVFLGFVAIGFVQDYELSHFSGGTSPPRTLLEMFGRLVPVVVLVLGIVLEWLDWTWAALVVNGGSFGFLGFYVLGIVFWRILTNSPLRHDPETGLAVAIVGIPCALIGILDFVLYWCTRA